MKRFWGKRKRRCYFQGWYLKQQNQTDTVALIPAFHVDKAGNASASLQVITGTRVCTIDFPASLFSKSRKFFSVHLGNCVFSERGCTLDVNAENCKLQGVLHFGPLIRPHYDIMGPFRFVPFMECLHSVYSLHHHVDGELIINGKNYIFKNNNGYMEGDRGQSFPKRYLWTQCSWDENSIMLSVAEIPFAGVNFTGCIGFFFVNGKEYRIATYCGAKVIYISDGIVLIRQKSLKLKIKLLERRNQFLHAPQLGSMVRTIHESASCRVKYSCSADKEILFDFVNEQAGFENNWADTLTRY